jgi:NAD(P)-dependent dehydrogenase (short-subunit alcohol dehydrogenase family)
MQTLQDKVAIVTGASSGIGRAIAVLFASEGAQVVVNARRSRELTTLTHEIRARGGRAVALAGDVTDEGVAEALVETASREFGGLDIAVNNAGTIGSLRPVSELSLDDWQDTLNTNLTSAFLGAKYQVPALQTRGNGSLIFTSSFVGHTAGMPGMAAYAASKAALVGLTQVLAVELGAQRVRVNALLPGGTDTPMNVANLPGAAAGTQEFIENLHALKRLAKPEEIAQAALFLASSASSFVTGTALLVDGGVSINHT